MFLADLMRIKACLMDEESEYLFDLRLQYMLTRSVPAFIEGILKMDKEWLIPPRDDLKKHYCGRKIIIFGAGIDGVFTKKILEQNGYEVYSFCDNDDEKIGESIDGVPVLSLEDTYEVDNRYIILASHFHWNDMFLQLSDEPDFDRDSIFIPRDGAIVATCGNQYFDCEDVKVKDGDIFVDAGVYDGATSKYVIDNFNIEGIIGFEANERMTKRARKLLNSPKVKIYQYAVWDKNEELYFQVNGSASKVSGSGTIKVVGESIDNVLGGEKATVIKMDIEGAEYNAINGARKTIEKYHPNLMISIYHKPEDILNIPRLILDICPNYKFYIRHYTSYLWETILYAKCI